MFYQRGPRRVERERGRGVVVVVVAIRDIYNRLEWDEAAGDRQIGGERVSE